MTSMPKAFCEEFHSSLEGASVHGTAGAFVAQRLEEYRTSRALASIRATHLVALRSQIDALRSEIADISR